MKKIISLLMIVLFSVIAYSTQAKAEDAFPSGRTAAVGDEPNGDGQAVEENNQAGVTALGAGQSQVKTCKNCQQAGNVILSSAARIARPGIRQSDVGNGSGSGSAEPVKSGN